MMVVLPSYFLVPFPLPVRWFQANHRDHLNPANSQVQGHVAVTRVFLRKDLGTRVGGAQQGGGSSGYQQPLGVGIL